MQNQRKQGSLNPSYGLDLHRGESLGNTAPQSKQQGHLDPSYTPDPNQGVPAGMAGSGKQPGPVSEKPKKRGAVPSKAIVIAVIAGIVLLAAYVFTHQGWSAETAQKATQALLDYYFKGDYNSIAQYMDDMSEDDLEEQAQEWREEMISRQFEKDVPVSEELKIAYTDFYIDLLKKTSYSVGKAVRKDDGFEVPVTIEPITSLSAGEFTLMDLQLNDDLSDADLNERVYSRELDLMKDLTENPSYGDPEEVVMHITKGEDGLYYLSETDAKTIANLSYSMDRHWSNERAEEAAEALLNAIYGKKYAELAEWSIATEEEINSTFGEVYSKEKMKEQMNKTGAQIIEQTGIDYSYSASDEIAEKVSEWENRLLEGTKYEIIDVQGDTEEKVIKVRLTPYLLKGIEEELTKRLEEEAGTFLNIGSFVNRDFEILTEICRERVENEQYAEPVDHELHFRYDSNKAYEPDSDDMLWFFDLYRNVKNGQT